MAHSRSALKRIETARKRTERNRRVKSALKTTIKKYETALGTGEEVQDRLRTALVRIDKAVTKGIMHKRTAARKKSRLTKRMNAST
ncbi:MAG: 30S ribosomal protein S20 [Eubacteriales bacterium]|nr:30S ribosomal protein S20 [Bacillota bacterium]MBV1727320.1 30S ribosomal protein S20 [Desulforudis sp.]MDP3051386.1 30S ribosomal protein S20 [Eubacteriales bacterium]MDQ7788513.1 30S ribosomal protein S20 [Clostridia bacterium]MBU4533451.1 30S ribosomal protein S20 [Bacillota bacterium]